MLVVDIDRKKGESRLNKYNKFFIDELTKPSPQYY